jgi:CRP-like cAMP-binding protein
MLHPLRNSLRLQLKSHPLLASIDDVSCAELFAQVEVHEGARGERLLEQGGRELRHFFVLDGLLKRVVTSPEGREMTLHFAGKGEMESCFEAWRQGGSAGFAVVCARRSLVASLPMEAWYDFLERHPAARRQFHEQMVLLGAAIVEHAVALLLLDAPSRLTRFSFRHPELIDKLPQKDVASHLNLSAETLCRLTKRHRAQLQSA